MIYLDNAATSWPKAPGVAEAMAKAITEPMGNVGRSAHVPAIAAAQVLYDCREILQEVIPKTALEKTIITKNATEALNIALLGTLRGAARQKRVLTTGAEHNAVARPLYQVQQEGVLLDVLPCDDFGRVDIEACKKQLKQTRYDLVVFNAANNVTGAINPIEEMVALCGENGVPFVIDGAQAIGDIALSSFPDGANGALCFSVHKGLLGPAGVGFMALYGDFTPQPLYYGGTGSRSDSEIQPEMLPDRYESGTPAIHAIAGSVAAISYVKNNLSSMTEKRDKVADLLWQQLIEFDQLRMLSSKDNRVGVISVTMKQGPIGELSRALYNHDIAVRSSFHCAPWTHRLLGTVEHGGAIRFSVGHLTTTEEIYETTRVLKEALYG